MTLTFVSIEAARAALLEIPSSSLVGGPAPEREAPKPAELTKTVKVEKAKPAPVAVEATAPAPTPAPAASSNEPVASVDYPTLQKAVFALAGKSRESAAAVAASLGVKTFKELPEGKWADALAAVNTALAEAA